MAINFTGITNRNEYYSNYYLSTLFENDLKERIAQMRSEVEASSEGTSKQLPYARLGGLRNKLFRLLNDLRSTRNPAEALVKSQGFVTELLNALGYSYVPELRYTEDGAIPVVFQLERSPGEPWLWIIQVVGALGKGTDEVEADPMQSNRLPEQDLSELDLLQQHFLPEQYPSDIDPKLKLKKEQELENILTKQIFALPNAPRWVMVVCPERIVLVDRSKWNDKRLLIFDIRVILDRNETSTLQAMSVLLHQSSLCPDAGKCWLDVLDDSSHSHVYKVSSDLKYAAREAVELIANEAIYYAKNHNLKFNYSSEFSQLLSNEALRYLYRLLFIFYLEARAKKTGTLPMNSDVYKSGYSLESLRDLEEVKLTPETENGYFFDDSLKKLFLLISQGVGETGNQNLPLGADPAPLHNEFSIDRIECYLFDDSKTGFLSKTRLRNRVWQRIISQLSLSGGKSQKERRGRVSYAQLGIIQLGAVYEGLLSYRGFFSDTDLYEVKKAGEDFDWLHQAYFVNEEQLKSYCKSEWVYDEENNLRKYPKGTFIYRLAGRDREKSASYYTPVALTQCLVKYALKELIGEKVGDENYKSADEILKLTICEPAMGSAAFLNEAINQLAEIYLRRKQAETGDWIASDKMEEEIQKVRMHLAINNIFGVDLNSVAVELGEISIWLNSMTKANLVPWFKGRLRCGNSLVGARRQVVTSNLVYRKGSKTGKDWSDIELKRIKLGEKLKPGMIYHFLLPNPNMAKYEDKVIKSMAPEDIKRIKEWRNSFLSPLSEDEVETFAKLSQSIDILWEEVVKQFRNVRAMTADHFEIFGHAEKVQKTTLLEKERLLKRIYNENQVHQSPPYQRIKSVMDYWCALWFWPIEESGWLPMRKDYIKDLDRILHGMVSTHSATDNGDLFYMPTDEQQKAQDDAHELGQVSVENLKVIPRIRIVDKVAQQQRFFHWELEFADIFADHGGFDLVLGNPPWITLGWNEAGLLSDYQPWFEIRKSSANDVAKLRAETIEKFGIESKYLEEYVAVTGMQNFLNARCNYPSLQGGKSSLDKCFIPQAWMINTSHGVSGLLHPEGAYNDSHGGKFRREIYQRLRDHFQFINSLKLFSDVHSQVKFSINIYGESKPEPHFDHIANLCAPSTVEECYRNSVEKVGGIKKEDGKHNLNGHPDRVIHVGKEELELFSQVLNSDGTDLLEACLPAIHIQQFLGILEKIATYPHHGYDYSEDYESSSFWNETNDQKNHTMRRDTQFPSDAKQVILSGPHIYLANPIYKTPRAVYKSNSDYDDIDLTEMPDNYLPRVNYVPDCEMSVYRQGMPQCSWDKDIYPERRMADYYRLAFRLMLNLEQERTLISAIIPCAYAHINAVQTVVPRGCVMHTSTLKTTSDCVDVSHASTHESGLVPTEGYSRLLDLAAICFSLVGDFYTKIMGKTNLFWSNLATLPLIADDRLRLRVLLLSCLTTPYAGLWQGAWNDKFKNDGWSKSDARLPKETFTKLSPIWTKETPLRSDYARRQALIEIDVLVARALGMTLDELCAIYKVQFFVLQNNENNTWYDQNGRIVFTSSAGISAGFKRSEWEKNVKNLKAGDTPPKLKRNLEWLPEAQRAHVDPEITYYPPFDKCSREEDYRTAWEYFEHQDGYKE